jgi:hypothetical protein
VKLRQCAVRFDSDLSTISSTVSPDAHCSHQQHHSCSIASRHTHQVQKNVRRLCAAPTINLLGPPDDLLLHILQTQANCSIYVLPLRLYCSKSRTICDAVPR